MASSTKTAQHDPEPANNAHELKDLKAQLRAAREEVGQLRGNLTKSMKKNEKLETRLSQTTAPKDVQTPPSTTTIVPAPSSPDPSTSKPDLSPGEHIVAWQPKFCPECATSNQGFKDETQCSDCGIHLGSQDYAHDTMKICPNCGTVHPETGKGKYKLLPGIEDKFVVKKK
jgi:hypothetical protein